MLSPQSSQALPVVRSLVMEKWHGFGRIIYFFRVFVLYILVLSSFFAASLARLEELRAPDYHENLKLTGIEAFQNTSGSLEIT